MYTLFCCAIIVFGRRLPHRCDLRGPGGRRKGIAARHEGDLLLNACLDLNTNTTTDANIPST